MELIKVERYFKAIKHPMGDGLYIKIGLNFDSEEKAEDFRTQELTWEEGVVAKEVSEEEYERETADEIYCTNCKKVMDEGYELHDGLEHYCSDECLHNVISDEEYCKLYDQGYAFWTTFEY